MYFSNLKSMDILGKFNAMYLGTERVVTLVLSSISKSI